MSDLLLGVDGGGSKTRAIVCDAAAPDEILATGESSSSNFNSVGFDRATAALGEAVAKTGRTRFAAACFGIAGPVLGVGPRGTLPAAFDAALIDSGIIKGESKNQP